MIGSTANNILCAVFVDGGYVIEALKQAGITDEVDPRGFGAWVERSDIWIANRQVLVDRTFYYYSADPDSVAPADIASRDYLRRIEALPLVRVGNLGWLRRTRGRRQPEDRFVRQVHLPGRPDLLCRYHPGQLRVRSDLLARLARVGSRVAASMAGLLHAMQCVEGTRASYASMAALSA
jgi:hypothetical protein